jgi:hypothetical protein
MGRGSDLTWVKSVAAANTVATHVHAASPIIEAPQATAEA